MLLLEKDAWSTMVKWLKQATNEYPPPRSSRSLLLSCVGVSALSGGLKLHPRYAFVFFSRTAFAVRRTPYNPNPNPNQGRPALAERGFTVSRHTWSLQRRPTYAKEFDALLEAFC